jgi:surface polysaccharide O-acyltransferase-like enzyme
MEGLILNLVSGAIGGNAVGRLIGSLNQGTVINSIAGVLGGGLGGQFWACLAHRIWREWQAMLQEWTSAHYWVKSPVVVLAVASFWLFWALCAQKWVEPRKTV